MKASNTSQVTLVVVLKYTSFFTGVQISELEVIKLLVLGLGKDCSLG